MDATRICETCGTPIPRNPNWRKTYYATRRFCDRKCQFTNRSDITRDYIVTDSGCWEWQGRLDANGYGKAYDPTRAPNERVGWAHRISYSRHVGAIPEGLELDHLCVNPPCINPEHLEPVTRTVNMRRAFERSGVKDRHKHAALLRAQGKSLEEISDALGLAGRSSAHGMVKAAIRSGLISPDDLPKRGHLTPSERTEIQHQRALGIPLEEIAEAFGIHSSHASRVSRGITSRQAMT